MKNKNNLKNTPREIIRRDSPKQAGEKTTHTHTHTHTYTHVHIRTGPINHRWEELRHGKQR